jgi:hypothetical protein
MKKEDRVSESEMQAILDATEEQALTIEPNIVTEPHLFPLEQDNQDDS